MLLTMLIVLSATPAAELARIQEHLRGASAVLASRDVSGLTPEQLRLRQLNAQRLLEYTAAARFPKNHVVPGRNPIFRDEDGTLCAVGALLWASGEHAMVEHIVATRNTATVWQLADEPGLAAWLDAQGLTLAEAARIQPGYDFESFTISTPDYVVELGGCSPPVQLAPDDPNGGSYYAYVQSSSTTTELFSDATCATPLPNPPRVRISDALHFRETTPGKFTLTFSNQGAFITQEHEVLLPDGGRLSGGGADAGVIDAGLAGPIAEGPAEQRGCGCSSTDAPLLFLALALAGTVRARRS